MTFEILQENLIELTIEELDQIIERAKEIKERKKCHDPIFKALEEAGYDFKNTCCEE